MHAAVTRAPGGRGCCGDLLPVGLDGLGGPRSGRPRDAVTILNLICRGASLESVGPAALVLAPVELRGRQGDGWGEEGSEVTHQQGCTPLTRGVAKSAGTCHGLLGAGTPKTPQSPSIYSQGF
jgi:hypothetical protein